MLFDNGFNIRQLNIFLFLLEPEWGRWTWATDCIKINAGNCTRLRTRSCNNTNLKSELKSCSGSHVEALSCNCPKGKKDIIIKLNGWLWLTKMILRLISNVHG